MWPIYSTGAPDNYRSMRRETPNVSSRTAAKHLFSRMQSHVLSVAVLCLYLSGILFRAAGVACRNPLHLGASEIFLGNTPSLAPAAPSLSEGKISNVPAYSMLGRGAG